ncbi:MAG TPA: hypothetical protein VHZ97_18545 [Pseudonocardiaceae bacterium]|nr:hypothetical protein [Pseudonocardiaceae bacterium]
MDSIRSFATGFLGLGRDRGSIRTLADLRGVVAAVGAFEPAMRASSDDELRGFRGVLRSRLDNGVSLDVLLPEAFAAAREAAWRALGQRQFDEQLMGGVALHRGLLVEMKTGEGKTLTAVAPAYLNSLTGGNVHVLAGDGYLAERDARWMAPVYARLGMDCALLTGSFDSPERRAAYQAEVTYGEHTEFCYDYLRDNKVTTADAVVQRGRGLGIVDEADLVMIDKANITPQITVPGDDGDLVDRAALALMVTGMRVDQDYVLTSDDRRVRLTDAGVARVENVLGVPKLAAPQETGLRRAVDMAIYAKELWQRDRDYLVEDGTVRFVDSRTGRLAVSRDGGAMHAALMAKEGLTTSADRRLLARMTVRGYLTGYPKLGGMTGVAVAESELYQETYGLTVVAVPPHRPVIRVDRPVTLYPEDAVRMTVLLDTVRKQHTTGRPILIGTGTIERSERISSALTEAGLTNQVLNARHHADEAAIISQSGRKGAITVVTRMAGRGVDIRLGGDSAEEHDDVVAAGGLFVLGTDLYETRRQEQHLRGRAGRQGDPGESVFLLSADQVFSPSSKVGRMIRRIDVGPAGQTAPIENVLVHRSLEWGIDNSTLRQIERFRESTAYARVLDDQCELIYQRRREALLGVDLRDRIHGLIGEAVGRRVATAQREGWTLDALRAALTKLYPVAVDLAEANRPSGVDYTALRQLVSADARLAYERLEPGLKAAITRQNRDDSVDKVRRFERFIAMSTIDKVWRQHLRAVDELTFDRKMPLAEYQRVVTAMFEQTSQEIDDKIVRVLFEIARS